MMIDDLRLTIDDWFLFNRQSTIDNRQFRTSHQRGLTFVELLMAATIFSILAVGFSAHLRGGVLAWRRATSTLDRLQEIRVAYDRLSQDLVNAIVFDASGAWNPKAAFGTDELRVYTVQPQWREGPDAGRVAFVSYGVVSGESGSVLTRSVQSVPAAAADEPAKVDMVLGGVHSWRLRYGYAGESGHGTASSVVWRDEWDNATPTMPKLIEITMELSDHTGGVSSIRQVVLIPHGQLGTSNASP